MRRTFTQLYVHLVWATWPRFPLIATNIKGQVYNVIPYECNRLGCHVVAIKLGIPLAAECHTLMESLDREVEEANIVQEEIS